MLDEYNYWTTYISHDQRELKAIWGRSGHRQEEGQTIEWNNSTDLSPSNDTSVWTSRMVADAYTETMLILLFVLVFYFTLVCCQCEREREITKREVDKSVITKVSENIWELDNLVIIDVVVFMSNPYPLSS